MGVFWIDVFLRAWFGTDQRRHSQGVGVGVERLGDCLKQAQDLRPTVPTLEPSLDPLRRQSVVRTNTLAVVVHGLFMAGVAIGSCASVTDSSFVAMCRKISSTHREHLMVAKYVKRNTPGARARIFQSSDVERRSGFFFA
jgi:hypothetical protein